MNKCAYFCATSYEAKINCRFTHPRDRQQQFFTLFYLRRFQNEPELHCQQTLRKSQQALAALQR